VIRDISIRSRYMDVPCESCGATITLDSGPEGYDGDPIEITTADDHEDDCPQAPEAAAEQPLSIQVHPALNGQEWIAFIPTNTDLTAENLKLGLVYGKTRYEAASKMLGMLDQLNLLAGRCLPVVFQES